ncbi:MAG: ASCH domain-containing protein [Marinilabiliaceae bacterium]|nr:ASCH domain-containing protein [Marinilabiliaceae bacterium]
MEKPTKENTLYLVIKQVYFDEILAGKKKEEYREIKDTTWKKYLLQENVQFKDGVDVLPCLKFPEEEVCELSKAGDICAYNKGVFPYRPIEYKYLNLAVGYNKDRQTMIVEVKDISFQVMTGRKGLAIFYDDGENIQIVDDPVKANACFWEIVYHLGKVVEHS